MTETLRSRDIRVPDALVPVVRTALERAVSERWAERIWARDATVWTADSGVQALIADRLGWLDAPDAFRARVEELRTFAGQARAEGFTRAVVCGMGGSSLAPEVLARSYPRGPGGMSVPVLDSTDPAAVARVTAETTGEPALFIIGTKSGTTTETLSFLAHFWQLSEASPAAPDGGPGPRFVAVVDPGKEDAIPRSGEFRRIFPHPPDVGGRYSALTYVGLVPGAFLDLDLERMLDEAAAMAQRCGANSADNPGLELGATIGALARAGRDKLTFVIEPAIASLGAWLEQLIAESTGKHGVGVVPVDAEPLGERVAYGQDRIFVRIAREESVVWWVESDRAFAALEGAHPVIDLRLRPGEGLGSEFFRWEFATAVAGAVLGINPFDEPNVTESKDNTKRVLTEYRETGALPVGEPLLRSGPLTLYGDSALRLTARRDTVEGELARHLERLRPTGYVAIQAYIAQTPERDALLTEMRRLIRDGTGRATTVGYGPRFLHSTGQLHKGGPRTGCFIQLVAGHPQDLPIPGQHESFGTLIDAQALGDFASLEAHELPVVRIHLSDDPDAGLAALVPAVERAL